MLRLNVIFEGVKVCRFLRILKLDKKVYLYYNNILRFCLYFCRLSCSIAVERSRALLNFV